VIDKLFFDGSSQKQGHVKHLVPPEFSHVFPDCMSRSTGYLVLGLLSGNYLPYVTSCFPKIRV